MDQYMHVGVRKWLKMVHVDGYGHEFPNIE